MRVFVLVLATGCSTMSLRAGAVMTGGVPAFQASVEVGPSVGTHRIYSLTSEYGMQTGGDGTHGTLAINSDVAFVHEEVPIARLGGRLRSVLGDREDNAFELRGAFYSGLFADAKSGSAGFGVELAGGIEVGSREPVFEACIVTTGKWKID